MFTLVEHVSLLISITIVLFYRCITAVSFTAVHRTLLCYVVSHAYGLGPVWSNSSIVPLHFTVR